MSSSLSGSDFWRGKKVFLTYPKSPLGAWTAMSLSSLGAKVIGFAEGPGEVPNLFDLLNLGEWVSLTYGNFADRELFSQSLEQAQADVVLHLGEVGPLTEGNKHPLQSISNSILGTTLLLEQLRETASVRSVVVASSDKVYQKTFNGPPLKESSSLAASDILPTAKLCSELIALSYRHTFFHPEKYNRHKVALATARLGNAIGGGDFSSSSLISQAVQSFLNNEKLEMRHPQSVRPWIHFLDQVNGILLLAEALWQKGPKLSESYNLGAQEYVPVGTAAQLFAQEWGASQVLVSQPEVEVKPSYHGRLDSTLAKADLNWEPLWDLQTALAQTAKWYKSYYQNPDPQLLAQSVNDYFSRK